MFNILKAILFGLVEGVTEWLPVSSTGHMILLNEFIKLDVSGEFWKMFLVVIQFGAILAVILLYWKTIWPVRKSQKTGEHYVSRKTISLWIKTIAACIPAAVVGLALDDWLDEHLYNWWVVAGMLILIGLVFLFLERRNAGREARVTSLEDLTMKDALIIGLFQLLAAVFPGTSRSGATIIGGLSIGVSRKIAAEFTFILAIPVMLGASLLKIIKFFARGGYFSGMEVAILLTGMLVAFFVSVVIIRFLMDYIRKHDFKPFGIYRIGLGLAVILYFSLFH